MTYIILREYWKRFHEEKTKSFMQVFKTMEKAEKVALFKMLFSAIIIIGISLFGSRWLVRMNASRVIGIVLMYGALSVEVINLLRLRKILKEKESKQFKQDICEMKKKYVEVQKWLNQLGYSSREEINQLTIRCEKVLEEWKEDDKRTVNRFEKGISLFFVPALSAIIAWILASNPDMHNMDQYILVVCLLASLGATIYFLWIVVLKYVEISDYSELKRLKYMIQDFYGVLDYCYYDNGLEKVYINCNH